MSLRPHAPVPDASLGCCGGDAAASGAGDRLAKVLAAGMRLRPATSVVFKNRPDFDECSICFEKMVDEVSTDNPFVALRCGHAFHVHCLSRHIGDAAKGRCPLCRADITEDDLEDILNSHYITPDGTVYENGRKVRVEYPDGRKLFYEGPRLAERFVRSEWPDGTKRFYEGERGYERKVRIEWPDGGKQFYEGEPGAERVVRIERPDGGKRFYEGERGAERLVRSEWPDGTKEFYEGERRAERFVRNEWPDGRIGFYEGERGAERLVRSEWPDGRIGFYEGERGAERLVRNYEGVVRAKRLRTRAIAGRIRPEL